MIEVNGLVDRVMVDFVRRAIGEANTGGAKALLIQLDSPGVVVGEDRLEGVLDPIRASKVPVVIWVGPSGAEATGGAGELVAAAAVAGRAPRTRVVGGPPQLLSAPTLGDMIVTLDGRRVGGQVLDTARVVRGGSEPRREPTVAVRFAKPSMMGRLLHTAASPPVAYFFLLIGLLLVVFEFFTAGVGVAAVVGTGFLVLGGYGLGELPVRPSALALVAVAFLGASIDIQAGTPRTWTVVGILAMVAGTVRLYDGVQLGLPAMAVGVAGFTLVVVAGMPSMVRARFSTPTIGRESLLGEQGTALQAVAPDGTVELRGAPWRARTNRATPIPDGAPVRVIGIDGLVLEVEPLEGAAKDAGH